MFKTILTAAIVSTITSTVHANNITYTCSLGGWFNEIEFKVEKQKTKHWTDITSRENTTTIFGANIETLKGVHYKEMNATLKGKNKRITLESSEQTYQTWKKVNGKATTRMEGIFDWPEMSFEYKLNDKNDTIYWISSNKEIYETDENFTIYGTKDAFNSKKGHHREQVIDEVCERIYNR